MKNKLNSEQRVIQHVLQVRFYMITAIVTGMNSRATLMITLEDHRVIKNCPKGPVINNEHYIFWRNGL